MSKLNEIKGWHSRGYLPHFDAGAIPQSITVRLAGSLPTVTARQIRESLSELPTPEAEFTFRDRVEAYLDLGLGETWLAEPAVAAMVEDALLHFDGERYALLRWVIMPNHLHALFVPNEGLSLSRIIHGWKSFTSNAANRILSRKGSFWQADYFDRFIRDEEHLRSVAEYVENNPVKAGLCAHSEEWAYGSARLTRGQDARAPMGPPIDRASSVGHAPRGQDARAPSVRSQ